MLISVRTIQRKVDPNDPKPIHNYSSVVEY